MKYLSSLLLVVFSISLSAQTPFEYEATYAQRIKMEMINGVYIPADFHEAFAELERLGDPAGIEKFKQAPEQAVRTKFQTGLGRWIFINWGLEEGSRYTEFLKNQGITYPDDMVTFTLVAWHRHLNGKPLMVEEELAMIRKRIGEEMKKKEAEKVIISKQTIPHKE